MSGTSGRTLQLLSLLQTHRFWPGGELASRLEVSERTLRRDVDRLRELGYPVDATRGAHGGYQLGAGASLPPLTVDEDEAIALVMALGAHAATVGGPLADASLAALSKVVQVLPHRLRRRAEALRSATVAAPFGVAPQVDAELLGAVALATRDHERLRLDYRAADGAATRRHVEPHQIVTVGRRWYLLAHDLERHDWRSFRLDRMTAVEATRAPFRPRPVPGDDAAAFVRSRLSRRDRSLQLAVDVHADLEHVQRRIGPWATVVESEPGRVRLAIEANDPHWAVFGIGHLDAEVTVIEADDEVRETLLAWTGRLSRAAAHPTG